MKNLFLLLLLLGITAKVAGQTYKTEFAYDYAGNRISRKVILLTSQQAPSNAPSREEEIPLNDKFSRSKIFIHPNPTKGRLVVSIGEAEETVEHKIYLYNSQGNLLISESQRGEGEVTLDLSGYGNGIYILSVRAGEEEFQYKIIKQ